MIAPSAAEAAFREAAASRILVKDGPYGTAIQKLALTEADYRGSFDLGHDQKGNNDILNLTLPGAIAGIGRSYIEAGADLLATNSFNANAISQADYGAEGLVREINLAAARILRTEIDAAVAQDGVPRFLAGALGPTNKTLSLSPRVEDPGFREVDFDGVKAVYREQIDALLDGGVDFILIETVFDTLNAKAAAFAAMEAEEDRQKRVPIMLSMTLTDLAGRNLSGQTVEAFWISVKHTRPLTIGLNCSFGATELRPHVQQLAAQADALLMVYPNAGLPNAFGGYDELPQTTGGLIRQWAEAGLINAVGGCCGTTPAHIAEIAKAVEGLPPRPLPHPESALRLSGLEAAIFA
ncbi:homocysteine S-methyltransferase family protein [Sandaracinobacter sp. RS1-74]|uniref:homocysteine S-methyltransferase family protein n=1 Tax=Sandaracinobacteroides sayramensis TaxID=2913411 RepID=UPI001EDC337B|nr:homocysteine S-methyltransferase family protein [Sandaracinobacteroides sayramensis]MCG2840009.1 homocysteine S-methyltransferase family protein [Sandaracinobacteroides sayramensis]